MRDPTQDYDKRREMQKRQKLKKKYMRLSCVGRRKNTKEGFLFIERKEYEGIIKILGMV